jgi:hypothetical protein
MGTTSPVQDNYSKSGRATLINSSLAGHKESTTKIHCAGHGKKYKKHFQGHGGKRTMNFF